MTRLETALDANDVAEMDSSRRGEPRVMAHHHDCGFAPFVFGLRIIDKTE